VLLIIANQERHSQLLHWHDDLHSANIRTPTARKRMEPDSLQHTQ